MTRLQEEREVAQQGSLTGEFEQHRQHLRAVAYRILGSLSEADDAVQDAWLRLNRADTSEVESLGGWLTTVVARVALNMLRSRNTRRELPLDVHVPDPIIDRTDGGDPEHEAILADSVGMALLVVLDTLSPPERLAFVLHDMFAVPFEDIATILERSPEAARQLASRARRRVRGAVPAQDADLGAQRAVVDAFLAASREGDFDALVAVLHPDVVLRADGGGAPGLSHRAQGAENVAGRALMFKREDLTIHHALVNGTAGLLSTRNGELFSVMGLTIVAGRIAAMDILVDPERLRRLDVTIPGV
jgi:RNA polymerase sigma factor (sigma-70 family)